MSRCKWDSGTAWLGWAVLSVSFVLTSTLNTELPMTSLFSNPAKWDFISKSHCKLPGFLFALTPFDVLSNRFPFPKSPFLVTLFIYFPGLGWRHCLMPQKAIISQHLFPLGFIVHENVSFKFSLYKKN